MTKIIQISDPHIVPVGQLAYGKVDTATALTGVVAAINEKLPQIGPVDLAIVTGDLTDFGTPGEYERFKQIMAPLAVPYRAVPGNHDLRAPMRNAFSDEDWMTDDGPIDWAIDLADFTVIGLDTLVEGSAYGGLGEASLEFLGTQMSLRPHKPLLVSLHHPPFKTGIHEMDRNNLRDAGPLREILDTHDAEVRLVCGHIHRNTVFRFGSTLCQIAPGSSHAVTLEQRLGQMHSLTVEPGAFLLHEWRDGFVSHHVYSGAFDGPFEFYPES